MNTGWISLHRKLQDNPLWLDKPFTRGQAWVDLLLLANRDPGYIHVRDHKIDLEKGDVGWSQNKLSERWGWSRTKVRKFLNMLEKEQQIKQVKSKSYTVIRLINYKQYQEKEQQRDNSRTTAEQQQDTNNKDNKGNKENNIYSFDQFWNDYDKKVGKAKSQKLFSKLKDSDLRMIKEHVPKFVASVQDKQYLKHPTTYLNEKVWLDEELPTNGQHQLRVPNQDFV